MAEGTQRGDRTAAVLALVTQYLDDVAARTHARLGDVLGVAVTMAGEDGGPVTAGASTTVARQVDETQYAIGAGPCLHALAGGEGQYVADLAHDDRWGDYGRRAAELGARCCVSVPVSLAGSTVAVIKVYADRVDGLTTDQRCHAATLATEVAAGIALATTLVATAREAGDRALAMDTRHVIDLAVGMLSERVGCDPETAFDLLRRQSQQQNLKVQQVAAQVVGSLGSTVGAPFTSAGTPAQPQS